MKLSNWEISYTILIFVAFIGLTTLNLFFQYKIRKQTIKKSLFWTLILLTSISELLILTALIFKILSFTFYFNSYKLEVIFANWIAFSALLLALLAMLLLPKETKKTKNYS